jgi:uncharacterized protein with gpF-like domain
MNTFKRYVQQPQDPYKIIQTNQGKFAILKPMIAPIHVAEDYYRQIMPLIKAMIDDYIDIVNNYYNNGLGELATDAKPSHYMQDFRKALLATAIKWNKIFERKSLPIAKTVVSKVDKHVVLVTQATKRGLKESNWYVPFSENAKNALISQEALIAQNVALIRNIPQDVQKSILRDVMEASMRGRDKKYLTERLLKYENITKARAKRIAYDQINKSTSAISTARQKDLGIKYNMWKHSFGDKQPRKSHLEANNKMFELDKGCLIDGEYIFPAEKINCTCYSVMVLKLD